MKKTSFYALITLIILSTGALKAQQTTTISSNNVNSNDFSSTTLLDNYPPLSTIELLRLKNENADNRSFNEYDNQTFSSDSAISQDTSQDSMPENTILDYYDPKAISKEINTPASREAQYSPISFDGEKTNFSRYEKSPCFATLGFRPDGGEEQERRYVECENQIQQDETKKILIVVVIIAIIGAISYFIIKYYSQLQTKPKKKSEKKIKINEHNVHNKVDELIKLKRLLDDGAISKDEYDKLKTNLLS